jgi:hypothetical protein
LTGLDNFRAVGHRNLTHYARGKACNRCLLYATVAFEL